ncbi:tRNA (adenosine(37)-N6)-dimethylallyltransferase MiaA [Microbacterium sp. MPKO10]|uniref:tRNA (adenosine(37)-N6)-dimethylallyltransferase MiaA n=1 Tax=Microbacterium sp. MPKO10 TaxID=2989818 RepID=UPI002235C8C3|nr:tRNA (adenosine(37)-N6)-dimethylallyltransferase MiaA [Microbacterium sp. MPKO10]MCW4458256.1 tRNA (adenosine(37)-N6)-dimethylallyltransferase MiaA [Microbacterium sp. MPKO10]
MNAPPLIVIVGATGTGKSALSLNLAEMLERRGQHAQVVNADAMQLYRGMDIGTAKLPLSARRGIRHHMLDVLEVSDDASVADYQHRARAVIDELRDEGVTPILVGGSGLYVSSVIYPFEFPGTDPVVRARLENDLQAQGVDALAQRLADLDADVARRVGRTNARRIVRALEIAELTGDPARGMLPDAPEPVYASVLLGVHTERETLRERLDARVVGMWRAGLVDETRMLRKAGLERSTTAGRAIGYAQAGAQLDGAVTEAEAVADAQRLTRRYARRQVSWFRRYENVAWLDSDAPTLQREAESAVLSRFDDL